MSQDKFHNEQIESSQRQMDQQRTTYMTHCNMYEQRVINTFHNTGAVLTKDGKEWCVLLGKDLQSGVAGFGVKPYDAMVDFFKNLGME